MALYLEKLKNSMIDNSKRIANIFEYLTNELRSYLRLERINKTIEISIVDNFDTNKNSINYGVYRVLERGVYRIYLFRKFKNFFPFLLLQSAYFSFIPNNLKNSKFIDYAINQIIEIDLQEFNDISEWRALIREKLVIDYFRFDKLLELNNRNAVKGPIQYFFEYIRKNSYLEFDKNIPYYLDKIYRGYLFSISRSIHSDEIAETLRILTDIFYRVNNCESLLDFYKNFKKFKTQGIIQTNLSFRKFKSNLQWINKFSHITPTYYFDWKSLNIANIACYIKFNPLLEKSNVDKVINHMPFVAMSKLAVNDFAVEFSALLVVPKIYLKEFSYTLEKMEQRGYFVEQYCFLLEKYYFSLNLNYFRDFYKIGQLIDSDIKDYQKKYEISFTKKYCINFKKPNLTLLDFLILDRIRFFSYVGVTFSRKTEIANVIKSDWVDFYTNENYMIKELKKRFKILIDFPDLQLSFLNYIKCNQRNGFFYLKSDLEKWINYFQIIEKEVEETGHTFIRFKEFYEKENTLKIIEESEIFDSIDSSSKEFRNLFSLYLNHRENYKEEVKKFKFYYKFFDLCSNLKIFSLILIKQLISNPDILIQIANIKESRLKYLKKTNRIKYATSTSINQRISKLLEKKIIKPYLIDSLWTDSVASYFPQIILKNTPEVRDTLNKVKSFFPKVYFYEAVDLHKSKEYIFFQFYVPFLNKGEKSLFISVLSNMFKENIISFKRFTWDGFLHTFSRKDFYNFEKKEFFYTKDLYDQYFLYVRRILGEEINTTQKKITNTEKLWLSNINMKELVNKVNQRAKSEKYDFIPKYIQQLEVFNFNLEKTFYDKQILSNILKEEFSARYIHSIKFFPTFQQFGFGQYLLYLTPFDYNEIDLKLLFSNTFQQVKHNSSIDSSNSLLINYIFPNNEPNKSYLNWLAKSKKNLREYCLFNIKSISQIFHFNTNLNSNGWNLDPNNLKTHIQDILFNLHYKIKSSEVKHFNVGNTVVTDYIKPNSHYFSTLNKIYNWKSIDIKNILDSIDQSLFEEIQVLIKKKLVYPYINLKNLDFREKIYFFLFNLEDDAIDSIKGVFQFFNLAYIYDIEGEYYIHGYKKQRKFKKGLMIKLYLPYCELSEVLRTLEYIFQYLNVERYLILTDLVEGKNLLKNIFGKTDFLKHYNPLKNLIWMAENNKWKNHRLFTDDFDYVYPELIFKKQ